jgi:hypothetical protein
VAIHTTIKQITGRGGVVDGDNYDDEGSGHDNDNDNDENDGRR